MILPRLPAQDGRPWSMKRTMKKQTWPQGAAVHQRVGGRCWLNRVMED